MIKYTFDDYLDSKCTRAEYRAQFNSPIIKIDGVYTQCPDTWHEKHWKIVTIHGPVALAVSVFNKISNKFINEYALFNVVDGWQYQDIREEYRLTKETK